MVLPRRKKITSRQKQFMRTLVDLTANGEQPVHYSDLAYHIGVSRFSAYDMLRVLEGKGLVEASFVVERAGSASGRSSVFYSPTPAGIEVAGLSGESSLAEEWRALQQRLLSRLEEMETRDYQTLVNDLLEQIPRRCSPLAYCSQVITALLIILNQARDRVAGFNLNDALRALASSSETTSLSALAGLSLGAGLNCEVERNELSRLFDYTRRYQDQLEELSEEGKRALSAFIQEVFQTINKTGR